jgi:hypothetical protein
MTSFDSGSDTSTSPIFSFLDSTPFPFSLLDSTPFPFSLLDSFTLQQLVVQPCHCFTPEGIQLPYFILLKN